MAISDWGDVDPQVTFAAVGTAIHHWEGVEAALAVIYSIFVGKRRDAAVISAFGSRNRITRDRIEAVRAAADGFFFNRPDQEQEGKLRQLLDECTQLSIERHRAGHGRLRALPVPVDGIISADAPAGLAYRWGAEIYSADKLKTSWVGVPSCEILASAARFETLERKLLFYAATISPSPPPDPASEAELKQ